MSYCQSDDLPENPFGQLPTKWISTYRWQALFGNLSTTAREALAARISQVETTYYVTGQLNADGSGSLNPILVQPGLPSTNVAPGSYALEVQDAAGTPLSTLSFFASFIDLEGNPVDTVYFSYRLAAQPNAARIVLKRGNETLATIAASDNPPTVQVLSPNGGENWSGAQTIRWQAIDRDGDALQFNILYTPDDGSTWFPVAAGVTGNTFEVNTASLPASTAARVRVIVTDGFHNAEDDSDETFTVVASPPEVTIDTPTHLAHFASGQTIAFSGSSTDDTLPDDAFVWSYGPTPFATGRAADAVLPDGIHRITLTVTGEGDQQASAQISIIVGDVPTVYLPLVLRVP
jgi:hypothetical protein